MARITIYKNSVGASICSIIGYMFFVIGVLTMLSESVTGGILLVLYGVGLTIGASVISKNKQFKTWKKQIETSGYVPLMQNSIQTAIQIYNTYPGKKTLNYIRSINPQAADLIEEQE